MNDLCIRDLADVVGGTLRLGMLPPLDGESEAVRRIRTDYRDVAAGDVYWCVNDGQPGGPYFAEEAYLRGAAGAVVSGRTLEPWAGTFSIEVDDADEALRRLALAMRQRFCGRVVNIYGGQAEKVSQLTRALLQTQLVGEVHRCQSNELSSLALNLVHLSATDDFALVAQPFSEISQEDEISHLSCPHVAVITRTATTKVNPSVANGDVISLALNVLQGLPDGGLMIVGASDAALQDAARAANVRAVSVASDRESSSSVTHLQHTSQGISFEIDDVSFHVPNSLDIDWRTVATALTLGRELGIPLLSMQTTWQFFQQHQLTKLPTPLPVPVAIDSVPVLASAMHSLPQHKRD